MGNGVRRGFEWMFPRTWMMTESRNGNTARSPLPCWKPSAPDLAVAAWLSFSVTILSHGGVSDVPEWH